MKKRLVTSALPYVNNIPHLGNLIQVLSADVFSRFCRQAGYETLYVCGTDEYGTATETRALAEGITPKELCDRYHKIHKEIYQWFNIDFDHFGRTSTPNQTEIVQDLFRAVDEAGLIHEKIIEQLYCESCDRFLADRYVRGVCPHCDYAEARGDQCESCGKLLEPTELISPRCDTCGSTPVVRSTKHLYIDLPAMLPKLEAWMDEVSVRGFWAKNAIAMTKSWIRDGLQERCITRDLKWGIPVPKEGYEGKVFYVWFDAPIGYISITSCLTEDWRNWWQNPEEVELFQFIGKDNIPFHTVIFPSTLLGSGEKWTMLHHMSSTEYLNYENGKFSKSKGVGVFGTDCQDTGIPSDVWRFYIFLNRPEKSDYQFTWKDFMDKVNNELIGNLSNLVNRTLTFVSRFYEGKVPEGDFNSQIVAEANLLQEKAKDFYDKAELKNALKTTLELASYGNKVFQEGEPWKARNEDPKAAASLIKTLIYIVRDLGIMMMPVIPEAAAKILGFFGQTDSSWDIIGTYKGITEIKNPEILFKKLEEKEINKLRDLYAGSQDERKEKAMADEQKLDTTKKEAPQNNTPKVEEQLPLVDQFRTLVDLRVAKIVEIERHPEAEKLYIEKMDVGEEELRTVVSGLVPYYTEEELLGKNIILVSNLKPAKLRGVKSAGMLLAASAGEGDDEVVEVLFVEGEPGTRIVLEGDDVEAMPECKRLKVDKFFNIPIIAKDKLVSIEGTALTCSGEKIKTIKVENGEVG